MSFSRSYDYHATGNLELSVDTTTPEFQTRWKDNGDERIEDQLVSIVQGGSRAFEYRRIQDIENERRRREWQKEAAQRQEVLRQRKIEEKRREYHFSLAKDYSQVCEVRKLLTALSSTDSVNDELADWLAWVTQ